MFLNTHSHFNTVNIVYPGINSSCMSPIFFNNSPKMGLRLNASTVSLNNTEINTLINIYPPTTNISIKPIDLYSHNSSDITTQTFYHLLGLKTDENHERENKRSNKSPRKCKLITTQQQQRFNFAKLADEIIKTKEDTYSNLSTSSSSSFDTNNSSSPAAIISGVSLFASSINQSPKYHYKLIYFQSYFSMILVNQILFFQRKILINSKLIENYLPSKLENFI